jgi:hypothetical protein
MARLRLLEIVLVCPLVGWGTHNVFFTAGEQVAAGLTQLAVGVGAAACFAIVEWKRRA